MRSRSPAHLEGLARGALESGWWTEAHRDLLDLLFHAGVMTVEQIARLFYAQRADPPRRAADDVRRLFRAHLLDYTADVGAVLNVLTLPPAKAVCLGRAGHWLVAARHDLPRLPWRAWALLDPAYLAHNLMLAELVVRVLRRAPDVQFGGEWAATVSEAKKVSTGKGTRTIPRPILRPDGFFRFPGGRLYLVEVERARRYDFRRILEKAQRYARVRERRPDLWKGRWGVETFPPVLVLALDTERHVARLREEARDNRVGFLFRAWAELLQGEDPLAGWRSWRDGTVVAVGAG